MMSANRVAVAYLRYGLDTLERMGFDDQARSLREEFAAVDLEDPDACIALDLYLAALEKMLRVAEPLGFTFEWSSRTWMTKHGLLLVGMQACSTLEEAFELTARYLPARMPVYRLVPIPSRDHMVFSIQLTQDCGPVRDFALISFALECRLSLEMLADAPAPPLEIELEMAEPAYYQRYAESFPGIRFGASDNRLSIDLKSFLAPRLTHDESALRLVERHFKDQLRESHLTLTLRVDAILRADPLEHGHLERVADRLKLSGRTLSRRLRAENTSFRQLRHKALCQKAEQMLKCSSISVSELAEQLGYSDTTHFVRAFSQWTGMTPGQYRQQSTDPEMSV
jgi:AraC-like DNA-binding protein